MVQKLIFALIGFSFNSFLFGQINYGNLNNWAAHPLKKDCADSVPKPLLAFYKIDTTVDVFFVHPTTYTSDEKMFGQNASIEDVDLNKKTDESTILYQASVFNEYNVYAPRYKQAHICSYFPKTKEEYQVAKAGLDTAYATVKAAFEYYLKYWNKGKPIIIASHSQGTTHAKLLMKEFFDGKPLQNKLVAAYLVGIPVEKNWFTTIKPCKKPNQNNCVCSWRTLKDGFLEPYMKIEKDTSMIVINPITFDAEKPTATRIENKGTILRNFNKISTNVVDANINNNVIWTEKPHFFGNIFLKQKNYHIVDYNFYWMNIRENVKERITAYKLLN